jgi:hypothetical protein
MFQLSQTLRGKHLKTDDKNLNSLVSSENAGKTFLLHLGFKFEESGTIDSSSCCLVELQGGSRALFALFWRKEFEEHRSSWCILV